MTSLVLFTKKSNYGMRENRFFVYMAGLIRVQTLDTMNKLKEINTYVSSTLDKLPGIRADLVTTDEDCQEWNFSQLGEALRKWTVRNQKIIPSPEKGFKL